MAYPSNDNKGAKNLVDFVVHLRDAEDAFGDVVNKAKEDITELINAVQGIDDSITSKTGVWSSEKVSTEVAASNAAAQAAHNAADAAQASANAAQSRADKGVADAATAKGVADKAASDLAAEVSRAVAAEQAASNAAAAAQRTADAALPLAGGTMTGPIRGVGNGGAALTPKTDNDLLRIWGGLLASSGANLDLYGEGNAETPGDFILRARNGSGYTALQGKSNGGLTWGNNTVLTTANGLPLSGGTMTGAIRTSGDRINCTKDDYWVRINGASEYDKGASLLVTGKDFDGYNGSWKLKASNSTVSASLDGSPNGTLTWNGKNVETVDSSGSSWIRYASGLQICRGSTGTITANTDKTISLPAAFKSGGYSVSFVRNVSSTDCNNTVVVRGTPGTSSFVIRDTVGGNYLYIAIGFWK